MIGQDDRRCCILSCLTRPLRSWRWYNTVLLGQGTFCLGNKCSVIYSLAVYNVINHVNSRSCVLSCLASPLRLWWLCFNSVLVGQETFYLGYKCLAIYSLSVLSIMNRVNRRFVFYIVWQQYFALGGGGAIIMSYYDKEPFIWHINVWQFTRCRCPA